MDSLQWVTDLSSIMEEVGFERIKQEDIACDLRLAKYYQDIQFMVLEEIAANKAMGYEHKDAGNIIKAIVQDSPRGKARVPPKTVFLGNKP